MCLRSSSFELSEICPMEQMFFCCSPQLPISAHRNVNANVMQEHLSSEIMKTLSVSSGKSAHVTEPLGSQRSENVLILTLHNVACIY